MSRDTAALSAEQLAAVLAPDGPVLIVAGPGSGKTTVLAERIGELVRARRRRPERILAFAFTRAAARTLRERLVPRLGRRAAAAVRVTTCHAFGRAVVLRWHTALGYADSPVTVLAPAQAHAALLQALGTAGREPPPERELRQLCAAIAARYSAGERGDPGTAAVAAAYERLLRAARALDYPGMLALPLRLFAERSDILAHHQRAYDEILVDEFQDLSAPQYRLVRLLAERHQHLTGVGDPLQTIYEFAGASAAYLLGFPGDYPQATVVELRQNFRSSAKIVAAMNALTEPLPYGRALWTANDSGPDPVRYAATDEADEARFVAGEIATLLARGEVTGPAEVAVVYRTNGQRAALARVLGERGIPCSGPMSPAGVRLATIHAAKGGEWTVVFVVGFEEDLLPHRRALCDARAPGATAAAEAVTGLAAERHLAYVAVSRPRTRLYLTYCTRRAETRSPRDDVAPARPVRPSRFLLGLPAVPVAGPRPISPKSGEREPAA